MEESPLHKICRKFIDEHEISCAESVWQVDQVNIDALSLIEEICEEIGYWEEK